MAASGDGVPVFKFPGWRRKGVVKEEVRCRYVWMDMCIYV